MVLDYMYTSFLLDKITLQIRHGTDVFSDTLQTDTVQTLFLTPSRLTLCRRYFWHPADLHGADVILMTPCRLTRCRRYMRHPADLHCADVISDTLQIWHGVDVFFSADVDTLQTNTVQTITLQTLTPCRRFSCRRSASLHRREKRSARK